MPSSTINGIQSQLMRFYMVQSQTSNLKACAVRNPICGALGVLHFMRYFQASQLSQLTKYHVSHEISLWVNLAGEDCAPLSAYCGYIHKADLPFNHVY